MRIRIFREFPVWGLMAALVVGSLVLNACRKPAASLTEATILAAWDGQGDYPAVRIEYPLDGAVFPPDIAPPTVRWSDPDGDSDVWLAMFQVASDAQGSTTSVRMEGVASVSSMDALTTMTRQMEWRLSADEWENLKDIAAENSVGLTVLGVRADTPDRIRSAARIVLSVSTDPVGAPLFYREVNLPFGEAVKDPSLIRWRFGSIASPTRPPVVLEKLPVCGNCHSFSSDGAWLGMDVDYANSKGSYVFTRVGPEITLATSDIFTWDEYRSEDNVLTFGLLSQVSPDGRYAISTVKDRSVFVPKPDLTFSQLFFPIKGLLAYYDRDTQTFHALPGADDPDYVQSNPIWSPDGEYIVFARARAYELRMDKGEVLLTAEECAEFLKEGKTFPFDLYRIPFNNGAGGEAEPLSGASNNGKSNFFPRYSPDGKWIVFCQAKSFMLLQPDSELYIIPAEGGEARRLACNTPLMNSWHSWAPNSRWLVFSSKANGPYTQMWLTHIDEEGRSSPPVVLDHMTASDRAVNIPEFVNIPTDATMRINEQFLNDVSFRRAGDQFLRGGKYEEAAMEYRQALELNPNNAEANGMLGHVMLNHLDDIDGAVVCLEKAVDLKPRSFENQLNLGVALYERGDLSHAESHLTQAVQMNPTHSEALANLAVVLESQERWEEAAQYYRRSLEQRGDHVDTLCCYGWVLYVLGDYDGAEKQWKQALRIAPDHSVANANLGLLYVRRGDIQAATEKFHTAVQADPSNVEARLHLGLAYLYQGDVETAETHLVMVAHTASEWTPYIVSQLDQLIESGQRDLALSLAEKIRVAVFAADDGEMARYVGKWIEKNKQARPEQ